MPSVGWGCYFAVGENPDAYKSRVGAYDWLIGHADEGWHHWRLWSRDIVGMSLRGLTWTAPTGLLLLLYGYGWVPFLNGIMMGPVYWVCQAVPITNPDFASGTPLAEFVWGCWIFLSFIVPMLSLHRARSLEKSTVSEMHTPLAFTPRVSAVFHAGLAVLDTIFILSAVSYYLVERADEALDDPSTLRNRQQTLIGLVVSTVTVLLLHSVVVRRQCSRNRRRGTYEWTSLWRSETEPSRYGTVATGDYSDIDLGPDTARGRETYRAHPEPVDDNPYARAAESGLHTSAFRTALNEDSGGIRDFGEVRLFDTAAGPLSARVERTVTALNVFLAVPPEDHEGDPGPVASPVGQHLSPCGCVLIGIAVLTALWTVVCSLLLVYVGFANNHYFGNPPFVHS